MKQQPSSFWLTSFFVVAGLAATANAWAPPLLAPGHSLTRSSSTRLHYKPQNEQERRRKRDIILRSWRSKQSSFLNRSKSPWPLRDSSQPRDDDDKPTDDENNDPSDNKAVSSSSATSSSNSSMSLDTLKEHYMSIVNQLSLPPSLQDAWQEFWKRLQQFQLVLLSFTAGAIIAMAAIFVPIYSQVETLSPPVTLFETILSDLETAYVDEVDTQKLFETGVSAMLRSLDPYTEFEGAQEASDLAESIDGRYAGVGLVISGTDAKTLERVQERQQQSLLDEQEQQQQQQQQTNDDSASTKGDKTDVSLKNNKATQSQDDDNDAMTTSATNNNKLRDALSKAQERGIRVMSAFEGYAFDYGLRVGDKLVAIDDQPIAADATVESVRNMLRGEPGTTVRISFERIGLDEVQTVSMPRALVRTRDVKLATLVGDPKDGVGYIQLTGFTSDAGRQMRQAITYLQQAAEDATNGKQSLQGLILDLRGNPGGLLTSAVDVASQLVPKGSDIVAARGRGFPGVIYRSRIDPILDSSTKLAVLVNGGTASAAEIVSGAVQDLDRGIIVGADRTFGKGLVQNVEELPFGTSLKFTVAKYYTPSGRCIQGITYKEGGGLGADDASYTESKVRENDRQTFYTKAGRVVKDGGGIEADFKVEAPKASALEITLLRSGVFYDFAAEWSKQNQLTGHNFDIDEDTYKSFQAFVNKKQQSGDLELEALYSKPLEDLKKALKKSGYKGSEKGVEQLQANIIREIQKDFDRYRNDLKEDISQSILARYLPESMLIERGMKSDQQVQATVKLLTSDKKYDRIMAKGAAAEQSESGVASTVAIAAAEEDAKAGASVRW